MDKFDTLKRYFGYTSFRNGQEELIDSILSGRDVLGIMPTGGGKSLCYQVPALMMSGITFVVSPLISLMKDQVMSLKEAGVRAAYINSSLSYNQILKVYDNIRAGMYKIIYIAPERLVSDTFKQLAQQLSIAMVTVDEAHCISQWGNDFRPSYLNISEFVNSLPKRPIVSAFTATATELVRNDIIEKLEMGDPFRIVTGFDRPNLRFEVIKAQKRTETLLSLVRMKKDKCGIIYCMTRNRVESICELLQRNGFSATRYHAGLEASERQKNQDDFVYDRKNIIVATNAFGMGIDKSNVSYVIHFNMPLSLEAYYQEAGRAGRDGSRAQCILLYSPADITTAKTLIENTEENEMISQEDRELQLKRDRARLGYMIEYCKTTHCLRQTILEYFGQEVLGECNNCSNCSSDFVEKDITVEARKIISCIVRINDRLGHYVGSAVVVRVLSGSKDKKLFEMGLCNLSTYGIMSDISREGLNAIVDALVDMGYLYREKTYGTVRLAESARRVLYENEQVVMKCRVVPHKKEKKVSISAQNKLFEKLRDLRATIASEKSVPAYIVFSNSTLEEMSKSAPIYMWDFMNIPGVGKKKADLYGKRFMNLIKEHIESEEQ